VKLYYISITFAHFKKHLFIRGSVRCSNGDFEGTLFI